MSKKELVQWISPEPGALESGPSIKVVKIRPGVTQRGWFVNDSVVCVVTHWLGGRTKPCTGAINGCEGCRTGLEKRPKAYIGVLTDNTGIVRLLEITEKAYDNNPILATATDLRGMFFEAKRKNGQNNSEMLLELIEEKRSKIPEHAHVDVREVLCRIWFGKEKNKPTREVNNA